MGVGRAYLKRYAKKQSLSLSTVGADAFKQTVGKSWSSRAADSCYMKLVEAQKKHGWDWTQHTLVLSAGQSINFMQCSCEIFPTITPTGAFLIFQAGEVYRPSGALSLALQGVQDSAMRFMGMHKLTGALQQNFAGNGFSANLCLVFLLAALLKTDP